MKLKPWNKLTRGEQMYFLYVYNGHSKMSGSYNIPKEYIRSLETMEEERRKATEDETYYS